MTVIKSLENAMKEKKTKKILTHFGTVCEDHFGYEPKIDCRCGILTKTSSSKLTEYIFTDNTPTGPLTLSYSSMVQSPLQENFIGYTCGHCSEPSLKEGIVCGVGHVESLPKADLIVFAAYGDRWPGKLIPFSLICANALKVPLRKMREITLEDIKEEF